MASVSVGRGLLRDLLTEGLVDLVFHSGGHARLVEWRGGAVVVDILDAEKFGSAAASRLTDFAAEVLASDRKFPPPFAENLEGEYSRTKALRERLGKVNDSVELYAAAAREAAAMLGEIDIGLEFSLNKTRDGDLKLGVGDLTFLTPPAVKQIIAFESGSEFLRPFAGPESMISLDQFWFSVLGMGLLKSFVASGENVGGGWRYLLLTVPPAAISTQGEWWRALEALAAVVDAVAGQRPTPDPILLTTGAALRLARVAKTSFARSRWSSFRMYSILKPAQIHAASYAETVANVDLHRMFEFAVRYQSAVSLHAAGEMLDAPPLEKLVNMARWAYYGGSDSAQAALRVIRDIYIAVESGSRRAAVEATIRALRAARSGDAKMPRGFASEWHVRALFSAIDGTVGSL